MTRDNLPGYTSRMQKRVAIHVHGLVQGVFFRHNTKLKADELGLTGFVRNEPDGSLLIEVQGDADSVDRLMTWAKTGPDGARVERTEKEEIPLEQGTDGFTILR